MHKYLVSVMIKLVNRVGGGKGDRNFKMVQDSAQKHTFELSKGVKHVLT